MRKIGLVIVCFSLVLFTLGCNSQMEKDEFMPKEMPSDFGFSLSFGVQKHNVVNTFEGTVVKDLIVDGTASTPLVLTDEEMQEIFDMMRDIHIAEEKDFIPKPQFGSVCMKEPYEVDEWEIVINGETIRHFISGTYCDPTEDTKEMLELRRFVWEIVKSKEEFKILPEANGAYE